MSDATPYRVLGFGRIHPRAKWHKLEGWTGSRCGVFPLLFSNGGQMTNNNPPGEPETLCRRCFRGAR